MERVSAELIDQHLDPGQQSVGVSMNLKHLAATPLGMEVVVKTEITAVEGRKLTFQLEAFDEVEKIGEAVHERFIIQADKFNGRVAEKAKKTGSRFFRALLLRVRMRRCVPLLPFAKFPTALAWRKFFPCTRRRLTGLNWCRGAKYGVRGCFICETLRVKPPALKCSGIKKGFSWNLRTCSAKARIPSFY